jgi:Tfp pilus assembly protein PilX
MKNIIFKKNKKNEGFVLLFAVLISTLVLAVGISMISIALKQVKLSGSGRDSEYAFYAANTGAECATYWDLASSSVFMTNNNPATTNENVKCLGMNITDSTLGAVGGECSDDNVSGTGGVDYQYQRWCNWQDTSNVYKTKFRISYDQPGVTDQKPYCADVIVTKEIGTNNLVATTTVTSRGYNTCDSNNPRRIERALEFSY